MVFVLINDNRLGLSFTWTIKTDSGPLKIISFRPIFIIGLCRYCGSIGAQFWLVSVKTENIGTRGRTPSYCPLLLTDFFGERNPTCYYTIQASKLEFKMKHFPKCGGLKHMCDL